MSSIRKAVSSLARNERINMSPQGDARACFNTYKQVLTSEERAWYENFMNAYFRGDEVALKEICPSVAKRREIMEEVHYNKNATNRRNQTEGRRSRYSENDYTPANSSPEDALIESIDTKYFSES